MATESSEMMRAIVLPEIGGPAKLQLMIVPKLIPEPGQVCMRVKAFGLNRSEVFTRQGHSSGVTFPRILGIEAAGEVDLAPETDFVPGEIVVTAMGGMGVLKINPTRTFGEGNPVRWDILGALPESMQTAWGSLFYSLQLEQKDNLLIRGGTTSVGLAAIALAKSKGVKVTATTRYRARKQLLQSQQNSAPGYSKILELIGVTTLDDSRLCAKPGGTVCMTGIAGNKWTYDQFTPMASIPTGIRLTTYAGSSDNLLKTPIEEIARDLNEGKMHLPIKTFSIDQIVEAHRLMEEEGAVAKIVMLP